MYREIYLLVLEAQRKFLGVMNRTPIYDSNKLGDNVFIKMENLQKTGSFKYRGAFNKISNLTDEEKARGVIASSAGNHAQGVAKSAARQGIRSVICIPAKAPIAKIDATRSYGAEVILVDGVYDDSYKYAVKKAEEEQLTFIHPFDDEYVIAGQGTIGLEILEDMPDVERIIVPIGGGGLCAGIAVAVKNLKPSVEVIGVEPENAASMRKALDEGHVVELESANTFADGIAVKKAGDLTFKIIRDLVDDVVTVTEGEIAASILKLLEDNKVVSEGAGAASIAALNHFDDGKKTVCVLSGGNINPNTISKIIQKGLYESGRLCEITTLLKNEPGQMVKLLEMINSMGINILSLNQFTEAARNQLDSIVVRLVLETRDKDQITEVYDHLKNEGYNYYENY